MNKRILVFAMVLAAAIFLMPGDGNTVSAQGRQNKSYKSGKVVNPSGMWQPGRNGKNMNRGRKNTHGYRNYGQYRRTQVGNRRSNLVRRYYTRDGRRLSRLVRIYN